MPTAQKQKLNLEIVNAIVSEFEHTEPCSTEVKCDACKFSDELSKSSLALEYGFNMGIILLPNKTLALWGLLSDMFLAGMKYANTIHDMKEMESFNEKI